MRIAVDTGGTFTDLVVDDGSGRLRVFKTETTPEDPTIGVLNGIRLVAEDYGESVRELFGRVELFIHGTTRATNAIVTKTTARTALLLTEGHPDILSFREGGRLRPFDFTVRYPDPYIPRALTFEVRERVWSSGDVVKKLEEEHAVALIRSLAEEAIDAVAVCLLWSMTNPVHELRLGDLLEEHLPGVPFTLSHMLNPTIREYRRAASTAIDASLKPLMSAYFESLGTQLRQAGFEGAVLVVTSAGGVLDVERVAAAPIYSISSGPAMAPVAGKYFAETELGATTAVVADAGGTSYDVSLVRRGEVPATREAWIGQPYLSDMIGFPAVDVRSIGAGGGSIAWIDDGGLLHVGPQSAGAVPGPVSYGRGGSQPTVTDASLVLGYIDPEYFLGGSMRLDDAAARASIDTHLGEKLGLDSYEAAAAILTVTTENMVSAIEDITLKQGIDPRQSVLAGGGGAAGLNAAAIARRLGIETVIIPEVGGALSAAGALLSDLIDDYYMSFITRSDSFDFESVAAILENLEERCRSFIASTAFGQDARIEFSADVRYPNQVWELPVPIKKERLATSADIEEFRQDFHAIHMDYFAVNDPESAVEIVTWHARARCVLDKPDIQSASDHREDGEPVSRPAYFSGAGLLDTRVVLIDHMDAEETFEGPLIVESAVTTIVVDPEARAVKTPRGSLIINTSPLGARTQAVDTKAGAKGASK